MTTHTAPQPRRRFFQPRPGWLVFLSLAVTGILFASERFQRFPFNTHKGWTVLIAVAAVGVVLLVMLAWFLVALILRRRFQFGIRTLLVLTVAVALPFSWLGVDIKKAREQREAVAAIKKSGGDLAYDWETETFPPEYARPSTAAWLRSLLGEDFFAGVANVFLENTNDTDSRLEQIQSFPSLRWLVLSNSQASDVGMHSLRGLGRLEGLHLENTQISDAVAEELAGLSELRTLSLRGTRLTDKGIECL